MNFCLSCNRTVRITATECPYCHQHPRRLCVGPFAGRPNRAGFFFSASTLRSAARRARKIASYPLQLPNGELVGSASSVHFDENAARICAEFSVLAANYDPHLHTIVIEAQSNDDGNTVHFMTIQRFVVWPKHRSVPCR